ncbi:hypothetical protein ACVWXO_001613 [Bradyrhizobium sp. LM2.7]
MAGLVPAIHVVPRRPKNVDARAFASPKRLRPRRRDKPGHDEVSKIFCVVMNLQRPGEGATVEQKVLPGDEAGLGAAQEGAGIAELVGLAEAAGGVELGALSQDLLRRDTALVGFGLRGSGQAVGLERAGQQAVDGDVVDHGLARKAGDESR